MDKLLKRLALINWSVMAALTVILSGVLVVYRARLPNQVPLWYTRPWGEGQLSNPMWLWQGVALVVITGLGGYVAGKLSKDGLLACMILSCSLAVQVILALGLLRIILLVL